MILQRAVQPQFVVVDPPAFDDLSDMRDIHDKGNSKANTNGASTFCVTSVSDENGMAREYYFAGAWITTIQYNVGFMP